MLEFGSEDAALQITEYNDDDGNNNNADDGSSSSSSSSSTTGTMMFTIVIILMVIILIRIITVPIQSSSSFSSSSSSSIKKIKSIKQRHSGSKRRTIQTECMYMAIELNCSVQDGIYVLGKAHMRSNPSLRSIPNVTFETVPMSVLKDDSPTFQGRLSSA